MFLSLEKVSGEADDHFRDHVGETRQEDADRCELELVFHDDPCLLVWVATIATLYLSVGWDHTLRGISNSPKCMLPREIEKNRDAYHVDPDSCHVVPTPLSLHVPLLPSLLGYAPPCRG